VTPFPDSAPGGLKRDGAGLPRCIFCDIATGAAPASFVFRDDLCTAFLDLFPVAPGHLLVVPNEHAVRLSDLAPPAAARVLEVAADLLAAERGLGLAAEGGNLLLNDGSAANQSVPHVHVHVVPRRKGDSLRVLGTFAARAAGVSGRRKRREELDALAGEIRAALAAVEGRAAATG
jgi:histidine triad (HIT) family protein